MKCRLFKKIKFGSIATFACAGMTLIYLLSAIVFVIVSQINNVELSSRTTTIVRYIINIIFYLLLTFTFSRVKDNFANAYQGMFTLTLATFVLPVIFGFISNLGDIFGFISQLSSSIVGIIYFIILFIDFKNRGGKHRPYEITLLVLGCIIMVFGLLIFISSTLVYVKIIQMNVANGYVFGVVDGIIAIIIAFFEFLISFLFFGYAFALRNARKYNY